MATRDIRTHTAIVACDVCGRTLLRGERSEIYVAGGDRKTVCELCKTRALHEGWLREGTVPDYAETDEGREHRGSLRRLLRGRRERSPAERATRPERPRVQRMDAGRRTPDRETRSPAPAEPREPRQVRAVPTSVEQKGAAAMELFNGSEHRRTIAGVARSLGAPWVSVRASAGHSSVVGLTVSWELCWYRYEVDLSDESPHVRPAGQGYELADLDETELTPNAAADEHGELLPV